MTEIDYSSDVAVVSEAMDAVYENKQVNKKNDISGDFNNDNVSYPTVKALKTLLASSYLTSTEINTLLSSYTTTAALNNLLADKVNISDIKDNLTSTDTNKPLSANQGKVLKDLVDTKVNTSDIKDNLTSTDADKPLSAKQGKLLKDAVDASEIDVIKQQTADTGYAATYYITQGGSQKGVKINVLKDKMLRSVSAEVVGSTPTAEETAAGLSTGDKYIKWVVNTTDNDGTTNLILPAASFNTTSADEVTVTMSAAGVLSIKNGGVDTAKLADGAVTLAKIAPAVKNSWLTQTDIDNSVSAFATQLANAINPPSSP